MDKGDIVVRKIKEVHTKLAKDIVSYALCANAAHISGKDIERVIAGYLDQMEMAISGAMELEKLPRLHHLQIADYLNKIESKERTLPDMPPKWELLSLQLTTSDSPRRWLAKIGVRTATGSYPVIESLIGSTPRGAVLNAISRIPEVTGHEI